VQIKCERVPFREKIENSKFALLEIHGKIQTMAEKPIYLDFNATTPHDPEVVKAMRPFLEEHFGNPSSSYRYGIQTKKAIEHAREQVADLINCDVSEIVFTSGGTESNNYAIKGGAFYNRNRGNHIIASQIEHPAVIKVCEFLEKNGFDIAYLTVDERGTVSISEAEGAITPQTILISIMHANNEVGTVQPVEKIAVFARQKGILVHTDAAQSIGKIPVDVKHLDVDLLSIAGHKLYAPKGIGALYIRRGVKLTPLMHGAGQEGGLRPGTENILEIVGLGKACEIAKRDLEKNRNHMKRMKDVLYKLIRKKLPNTKLNGHPENCLPNTLSLSFKGLDAQSILSRIQRRVAASAGAACHSGRVKISHVLKAMGIPEEWAKGTIRFSTGKITTEKDVEVAASTISDAVSQLRKN
jgi:cysteine desulfurase